MPANSRWDLIRRLRVNLQYSWLHSSMYGAPRPTASKKFIVRTVHRGRHWMLKKLQISTRKDKGNLPEKVGSGASLERTECWQVLQHHRRVSTLCGFLIFTFRTCDKRVSDNNPRLYKFIFLYFQLDALFFRLRTISAILFHLHFWGLTGPSSGGLNCTCSLWYSPPLQMSLSCGRWERKILYVDGKTVHQVGNKGK